MGEVLADSVGKNIREVYAFIAANYIPGDEIILIGFSRGAFTVRSVAGMIDNIGKYFSSFPILSVVAQSLLYISRLENN